MKRMLFNATQQEELRVAIVNGQKLIDIDIETAGRELRKSNIYKGVITRIEPSLEACFVNYGEERHGFLPFKEIARSYFKEGVDVRSATIKEALREGQEIVVQVEKEERGNKGAALTTFVSLAGRYLVLMPNNPRGGGVSRRVEGEDRQELRETMDKLDIPGGMSVIARTAGIGRNVDELQWDLNYLMQLWRAIEGAGKTGQGAFLIYQESSLVIRAIRDYFQPDIGEILIDTDDIYEQAQQFMSHVMPDMVHRVKRYSDDVPLFSRFQIEHQIETAYSRTVPLPSGGAIVIDHTEALVSVDVNSARSTRGGDIETTAFNTNLEAAEEVARQLRLRDLGGLIVIDFIDMENSKNQREVETRLKDALRYDRARVQMGKISRFGLMELSRQRLRPSLSEGSHITCPRCNGTGHIRDTESSALQVLRIIQEEAMKEHSAAIHVQVPVDVAAFLLNEKRGEILKIETRHRVTAILIPNKHLETPHYKLDRLKHDDPRLEEVHASYAMAEQADTDIGYNKRQKDEVKPRQEAVVKSITPDTAPVVERKPAPTPSTAKTTTPSVSIFTRIANFFRSLTGETTAPVAPTKPTTGREKPNNDRNDRNRNRNRNRNGRGRDKEEREERTNEATTTTKLEKDVTKAAALETNPTPNQRQNKQAKQPREDKEARAERQQKQREARQKPQIESKASATDEAVISSLANTANPVSAELNAIKDPVTTATHEGTANELSRDVGTETEASEEGRRRRRGGRNRNRRDRQNNENTSATEATDHQQKSDAPPAFIPISELLASEQIASSPIQASLDLNNEASAPAAATESFAQAAAVAVEAIKAQLVTPAPEALAIEKVIVPVTNIEVPAIPETAVSAVSAVTAPAAEAVTTQAAEIVPQVVEVTTLENVNTSTTTTTETETTAIEVAAIVEVAQEIAPVIVEVPAPVSVEPAHNEVITSSTTNALVPAPVVNAIVESAPQTLTPSAASASVDLQSMLQEAGLQLASTHPDKLKAAQMAAQQVTPAVRVPRERKPQAVISNEPLVMIETKR
jgi:ribonuclease E